MQLKRGAPDRAVADYAAAVAQDRNDADSLFGRGIARLRMGDRTGGEADIAAAGAIRADITESYVGYGALSVAAVEATETVGREGLKPENKTSAAPVQTAELAPPPTPAPQVAPPLSGGALVKEIKKGLAQLGCYTGPIDDKWKTASTRSAVNTFVAAVHLAFAIDKPSNHLLGAVRSSTGQVCPAACGPHEVKRKGECVAKTCPGRLVLDRKGKCMKPGDKRAAIPLPLPAHLAKNKKTRTRRGERADPPHPAPSARATWYTTNAAT